MHPDVSVDLLMLSARGGGTTCMRCGQPNHLRHDQPEWTTTRNGRYVGRAPDAFVPSASIALRTSLVPLMFSSHDEAQTMKTQFLVLPYKLGARNKIEPQQAQTCRSDTEALRTGERMARRFVGVVVISQQFDDAADFAADPVVLATHGTVPDQWDEFKIAA